MPYKSVYLIHNGQVIGRRLDASLTPKQIQISLIKKRTAEHKAGEKPVERYNRTQTSV